MREIKTDLNNILSLISCAPDYGFNDDILMQAFADMIDTLSDSEIVDYALLISSQDGCGAEDYVNISERLYQFRKKYIENK